MTNERARFGRRRGARWARGLPVLAVLALGSCDRLNPFELSCEFRLAPTRVSVATEPVQYVVDHTLGFAALTQKSVALVSHGRSVLGLTEANLRTQVQVNARGLSSRFTGRYCMRPEVAVTITFNPMKVYMGADEPAGSCRYRITWEHEMRHVAVYQEFLPTIANRIERQLTEHFGNTVYYFKDGNDAQSEVDRIVTKFVSPLVRAGVEEVRALQRQVDQPAEYARLDELRGRCER